MLYRCRRRFVQLERVLGVQTGSPVYPRSTHINGPLLVVKKKVLRNTYPFLVQSAEAEQPEVNLFDNGETIQR